MGRPTSTRTKTPFTSALVAESKWPSISAASRKDSGRQVKVPRACVRRPHSIQEIGGRDGDHPPLIIIDRRQFSRRVRQQPSAGINFPPPRHIGCHVCGQPGCHSYFHGPNAVSPQAPPGLRCFVCGQWGCHSSRHPVGVPPLMLSAPEQARSSPQRPAPATANQQSNWQRGSTQGERAPLASPRPQSN